MPDDQNKSVSLLADYLADHDAPCPGCHGNLRNQITARCPSCGKRLILGEVRALHEACGDAPGPPMPVVKAPTSDEIRMHLANRDVLCPNCNYNLKGATGELCPECGLYLPESGLFDAPRVAPRTSPEVKGEPKVFVAVVVVFFLVAIVLFSCIRGMAGTGLLGPF